MGDLSVLERRYVQFALLGYFLLRLTLSMFNISVIEGGGIRITTSDLLLVLLFATVVSDYREGMSVGEHIYAFVFGVIGIFLYFYIGGVFPYLTALFGLCIVSTIVFSRRYSLEESLEVTTQFTGLTVLLALTGGLLRSWQWVPDLVLIGVGVYVVYRYVFRSATEGGSLTGAGGFLFSSAIQIGQTPKGIVTGGILYVGLFSGIDTVAQLFPFLVSVYLGSGVAESFKSIVLNGSSIFSMGFLAIIMFHWLPLLRRLPYSVRHWESGRSFVFS